MQNKFTVGLVQMRCTASKEENLAKAEAQIRESASRGAQIISLHELFAGEYFCRTEDPELFNLAEAVPGPTTDRLAKLAKEKNVALVVSLFERRAPGIYHNAVAVLKEVSEYELRVRLQDRLFARRVQAVLKSFDAYMTDQNTWAAKNAPSLIKNPVAYFSAEFGFHETLPIAAGGLGILAGDHSKSASDLGLGFAGISLFYREGYFQQAINQDNWQTEYYNPVEPHNVPLEPVLDADGERPKERPRPRAPGGSPAARAARRGTIALPRGAPAPRATPSPRPPPPIPSGRAGSARPNRPAPATPVPRGPARRWIRFPRSRPAR